MDRYDSKPIVDAQQDVHKNLRTVVEKHARHAYRKPYQQHNVNAMVRLQQARLELGYQHCILDSCCGTAMSSLKLAEQNPETLVVAVDQSSVRLSKQSMLHTPRNLLILRANCEDLWRLCVEAGLRFDAHYILYPNPWPKSEHLLRRWHGHPAFPYLVELAEVTELRSNWPIYLQEFAQAWDMLTKKTFPVQPLVVGEPMTLFERKYAGSGQCLYQLIVRR